MRRLCALILGFVALTFAVSAPFAATFQVTKTADTADGVCDADCSLREAVVAANAIPGSDEVILPAGTYGLTSGFIVSDDLTLTGAGASDTIVDGGGSSDVLVGVGIPGASVIITGVTLRNATDFGILGQGSLSLVAVAIRDNAGLGILSVDTLVVTDSAIVDNGGPGIGSIPSRSGGSLTIINSTISGNAVGIEMNQAGTVLHSTLTGNGTGIALLRLPGPKIAGSTVSVAPSSLNLGSSVIAGNLTDCTASAPFELGFTSSGYNVDGDGSCVLTDPTDLPNTDALLGSLQDNGGPTWTHALLPGSPAIDAIPQADCTVTSDQRGVPRPQSPCDIGAYEVTDCADGANNDGDAFIDTADPGCHDAASLTESPQCQDGINNDPSEDAFIDFDGGLSALGYAAAAPDPQCQGKSWRDCEWPTCCGLGFELALILPGLMWLRRRQRQ